MIESAFDLTLCIPSRDMGILNHASSLFKGRQNAPSPTSAPTSTASRSTPTQRKVHNVSSAASIAPSVAHSARSEYPGFETLKFEVLASHILSIALREGMMRNGNSETEGVFLRRARNDYFSLPFSHHQETTDLLQAVKELNPMVSFLLRTGPRSPSDF